MLEAYPYVPIAGHVRIGRRDLVVLRRVYFGITGDWHGAPDIDRLAREIDIGFEDLLKEAASAIR